MRMAPTLYIKPPALWPARFFQLYNQTLLLVFPRVPNLPAPTTAVFSSPNRSRASKSPSRYVFTSQCR